MMAGVAGRPAGRRRRSGSRRRERAVGVRVLITGAGSRLGAEVVQLAAADPDVDRVVAVDRPGVAAVPPSGAGGGSSVESHAIDLTDPELKRLLEEVDTVVHLGRALPGDADELDGLGLEADLEGTHHLLAAASAAGVRRLVVLSSALVYGAWANNPVPLTEEAPLRPDPGVPFAVEKAELERLAAEWGASDEHRSVAVLRPTVTVDAARVGWLPRSPWSTTGLQVDEADPPRQFLHLADLASAVDLARRDGFDGPVNVAPDGWIPAELLRSLAGGGPRLRLPAPAAQRVVTARWRAGLSPVSPAMLAYTMYPWVVANDRLEAAGWSPTHSNEEAYVEGDSGGAMSALSPRQRQLLSLGAVVAAAGLAVGAVVWALGRRRR